MFKKRMVWIWTVTSAQADNWGPWWGTCREWASESRPGCTVSAVRTMWVGPVPGCFDPMHRHAAGSFTP